MERIRGVGDYALYKSTFYFTYLLKYIDHCFSFFIAPNLMLEQVFLFIVCVRILYSQQSLCCNDVLMCIYVDFGRDLGR